MADSINFHGQTYTSVDDMPPNVRAQYEQVLKLLADANQNGIPDVFESPDARAQLKAALSAIIINGQTYTNPADLPPEARARIEQLRARLAANHPGLPDNVEHLFANLPASAAPLEGSDPAAPAFAASDPLVPNTPTTWGAPVTPPAAPSAYSGPSVVSAESSGLSRPVLIAALVALALLVCVLAAVAAWALLR